MEPMEQDIRNGKYKNALPYAPRSKDAATWEAYIAEERRIHAQFKADLLDEFGLTNHPKADKIFEYVWQEGHAYGHSEVYGKMLDLAELFTD